MADHDDVRRLHGYHPLRVRTVVDETAETRSFVLDVPAGDADLFAYRAGQFCTFRVQVGGEELLRCYSMSSAPETDRALAVTVKRVPGGSVSNWLLDNVAEGDVLEVTKPAGVFCVPEGDSPVVAFCGGSGVTPVFSIVKSVLATSDRSLRVLYANRDCDSVIFGDDLTRLEQTHADRLSVRRHFDSEDGYLSAEDIRAFSDDVIDAGVFFLCGPTPFMDLVEMTLVERGVSTDRVFVERFGDPPAPSTGDLGAVDETASATETVTIVFKGQRHDIAHHAGDTILETARRGGLAAPYSCEAGNCATCMALVHEGTVTMRANNALTPDEVDEGWVLTCQGLPSGPQVTVEYESF